MTKRRSVRVEYAGDIHHVEGTICIVPHMLGQSRFMLKIMDTFTLTG